MTDAPSPQARGAETRARLMAAALDTVREEGLAGASARTIASRAGVNQALVFYHFGTVAELVEAASADAVEAAVDRHRTELARVRTLRELLDIGRRLDDVERETGNVMLMAQLMAGGQHDPVIARAARHALDAWARELETVLRRVVEDHPVGPLVDAAGLSRAVAGAFIGLQLYEGVDADAAQDAMATLESFATLLDAVDDLGPMATLAVRGAVRTATDRRHGMPPSRSATRRGPA